MSVQRFTLTVDVPTGKIPAETQLKRVLKILWRAFRIRCIAATPDQSETSADCDTTRTE